MTLEKFTTQPKLRRVLDGQGADVLRGAAMADENDTTLSRTIATLRQGARPTGKHVGAEVYALHGALRKRGWLHGWSMAVKSWPTGQLLETARDAHEEVYGNRANTIDTNRTV